jgi:ABC-type polysaccharide/polyol phosphate transport system ATPase subunit
MHTRMVAAALRTVVIPNMRTAVHPNRGGLGVASVPGRLTATASHTVEGRARLLKQAPAAVSVERVSKGFHLPHQKYSTLKERALHPFASSTHDTLRALEDASFEVKQGEFFGIVGRNGSGKSTLLKCLAGIYAIDSGEIDVRGRLSPFIELGVGFNPDLTARDNVVINAIMLGLTRREAQARFDEIIAFAELEEFIDLKLKNYSSGMSVRLGFSTAIQVDADVLLVDEVLAVGDASFQAKCFAEFERMKREGRTILFVTHDMNAVERFCDRAMLIERGSIVRIGPPDGVSKLYSELNFGRAGPAETPHPGSQGARVRSAWSENENGERIVAIEQGSSCRACFEVEFDRVVENPLFAVTFRNDVRHTIFVATSSKHGAMGKFGAGVRATVRFEFPNWLGPSRYTLTPSVSEGIPPIEITRADDATALIVEATYATGSVVDMPTELTVERA